MLENEKITLSDGRTLSYAVYGSPVPRTTAIYMHGYPSSRFEGKLWHSACTKLGIRLIAPDRPGNGMSTHQPNRCILDWPADVIALADQLKVTEFYALGVSGGAPYALACLKAIPANRLLGVTIVSGLYPVKFGTEGMLWQSRVLFFLAPWMTGVTSFLFDSAMGKAARNEDPKIFEDKMSAEIDNRHAGDREALKDSVNWPIFVAMTRESFAQGSESASWEARLYGSEWGFELDQLCVGENDVRPTLWHGTEDANCPVGMATKAKELMPGSVLHLKEGDGHVSYIFREAEQILRELVGYVEIEEYIK
ncbi:Alpha/Beta hydrolase protein [Phaeosphaeriaceae sp. PMI808]|nr:Alpha/Beta hydrolase protein [Phaeosphaeriaceae sp. PMI808]